jgi:hypothetical protein
MPPIYESKSLYFLQNREYPIVFFQFSGKYIARIPKKHELRIQLSTQEAEKPWCEVVLS